MSNWQEVFVKCVEGSTHKHSQMKKAFAIKAELEWTPGLRQPGKLHFAVRC